MTLRIYSRWKCASWIAAAIVACAGVFADSSALVLITEIFPRATTSVPEWFELYNRSPDPVDLLNLRFGNDADTELITTGSFIIAGGDYCVITRDKAQFCAQYPAITHVLQPPHWKTLDNYNDTLMLWDGAAVLVERVFYRSASFTNWTNQALERLDTAAGLSPGGLWALAERPTPGQPNTALTWHNALQTVLDIGPIPFSPNNDNNDDYLAINVQAPADADLTISIYGFSGIEYYSFSGPARKQYLWNGICRNNSAAPVGPFFVVARIKTAHGDRIMRKGGVLWR